MNNLRLKRIILCLLLVAVIAMLGCAQRSVQSQGKGDTKPEGTQITVKGKIAYMKALGGYFVNGEDPAGEFMIVNQDPKALDSLFKSAKTVIIEGRLTMGADWLFVERIDGKEYFGKMEPAPK